ncbi:unnamed protein product [Tuber melanosporum]|uniref:(Perigord truffle) hypothetical protein n=1 Tax=Tuber melanosporum (strain Mel28) TaxID=656061 RepID=D5G9N4_TUBMM|nr:uncharacterized protein GSTUM_00004989001 [Tuber melanosporum]CAZ81227.1 unnamed protein product [Tuber melanosporum]
MNSYTAQHVVDQPPWIKFIRIAQVSLSVLILALAAFALSAIPYGNTFGTFGFNIFTCMFTLIVGAYLLITPLRAPKLYNCWAAFVLEIFGVFFWLSPFATQASWASLGLLTVDYLDNITKEAEERYARYRAGWRCAGAAAGLGGIVWILFMITLITYSIFLHRHKKKPGKKNLPENGSPAKEGGEGGIPRPGAAEIKGHEMGSVHVVAVGGDYPRPYQH